MASEAGRETPSGVYVPKQSRCEAVCKCKHGDGNFTEFAKIERLRCFEHRCLRCKDWESTGELEAGVNESQTSDTNGVGAGRGLCPT